MKKQRKIDIYDTTLRDGAQTEDISFSVEDKLRITEKLAELGVDYVEGGWPGANPKDVEFFRKVKKLPLESSRIVAFGSTHRPKKKADKDETLKALLESQATIITIFGKTWDFHVREALKVSLEENLDIIYDSVAYLKKNVERVFFDAEHFFDGYANNREYALRCLVAAKDAGADCLVLCDTNGGSLPGFVSDTVSRVVGKVKAPVGVHLHNDGECAVANSIVAVEAGAGHVQGTINGLGERCGNANLVSIIADMQLKLGLKCISTEQMKKLREVARFVDEIANLRHFKRQPFVGDSAFAHKAGIHVSAILKNPKTYEHVVPETVGNMHKILISDLSGKRSVIEKAAEFGIKLSSDSPRLEEIVTRLKDLESQGYQFEGADASFELLIKKVLGRHKEFFDLIEFKVYIEKSIKKGETISDAIIKIKVKDEIEYVIEESKKGPVNALDRALRKALEKHYSKELKDVRLLDYKVRVLKAGKGTSAKVRVLVESGDKERTWGTVGVSENIIEASYQALVDSIEYKLLREEAGQ